MRHADTYLLKVHHDSTRRSVQTWKEGLDALSAIVETAQWEPTAFALACNAHVQENPQILSDRLNDFCPFLKPLIRNTGAQAYHQYASEEGAYDDNVASGAGWCATTSFARPA